MSCCVVLVHSPDSEGRVRAWRSTERDDMHKIAMGYEAVCFGRDMSPRFNIVVGRVGYVLLGG